MLDFERAEMSVVEMVGQRAAWMVEQTAVVLDGMLAVKKVEK